MSQAPKVARAMPQRLINPYPANVENMVSS